MKQKTKQAQTLNFNIIAIKTYIGRRSLEFQGR